MTTDPAAAVRAREQEWIDVYLRADADAFAALLADDFVYTSERGVFDKAAYVGNLRTGEIAMRDFRVGERAVRVYGGRPSRPASPRWTPRSGGGTSPAPSGSRACGCGTPEAPRGARSRCTRPRSRRSNAPHRSAGRPPGAGAPART
jgi:hypothetical protein